MLRIVLLSCLVAGGLSAKLSLGPEHRSSENGGAGFSSDASFRSSSSSAGGSLGFNNNGRPSGSSFRASGGNSYGENGANSYGANGGAGFNVNGGNSLGASGGSNFGSNSDSSFNGGSGFNGNDGNSFNTNGGSSFGNNGGSGFNSNGGSNLGANSGGQFDDGSYRPDEANGQYDDGIWKPTQYAGDDGVYRDEQYAPNTDASYQFQFDAGDHGRDEAADAQGEVQGSFYAVHPDGQRRDVEFSAGQGGFVVTRDESVQGPVPEYALRQAEKPRKEYPPAEIITSLSPDGVYHWEYDAGDSARSEDINLNTNYYEGDFSFTADDDQQRYAVKYKAGAGIGFVPEGDHLPMQVQETPEVAEAKAAFLETYAEAEAEARARPNAYKGNGAQRSQANNGNGFQRPQANNGNGFQRSQSNNGNDFQRSQANNGNGFQRSQTNNGNGFQRSQSNNGNDFQRSQSNNGNGFQRSQTNNGNGFQRSQSNNGNDFPRSQSNNGNNFQRSQSNNGNNFQRSQSNNGNDFQRNEPFGAGSQTSFSSAAAPQRDSAVHPSQMVSGMALGGHMKTGGPSGAAFAADATQISDTYLPPGAN